ncbi:MULTISPECIES: hypothetical protein [unclassified Frondihabitans]|uniref:hypothetical protein n=1 Tax=unclassified Frondihabitans TaxID=2626248 RepID=UPI000F4E81C2|nr:MULTISPECIES: hypothetical protein [unclassified Frondihabitans]RPE77890.1 hypothetical protein EDF37_0558 [Frondihabitans sp. PhB153]RPF08170.1 hypothetical protein EDF39_0559 [Frondihabitans sp. PhB161]
MTVTPPDDFLWLPDHQLHILATLGHVDDVMVDLTTLLRDHSRREAFALESVRDGANVEVRIAGIRPIPPIVSRLTADVVNNLRNVLEHALFAAVEHDLVRPMTEKEARSIEVSAVKDEPSFDAWLADKRRAGMPPLSVGSPLAEALRSIQPFTWTGPKPSPLALLVEHSNASKHRVPAIAQMQLGQVTPDFLVPGMIVAEPSGQPAKVGDLIASGPPNIPVGLDIWATATIRRPLTGGWVTLQTEMSDIEAWVRTVALPTLLGLTSGQVLPATVDVRQEVDDLRAAAMAASDEPAAVGNTVILMAEGVVRPGLLSLLLPECSSAEERHAVKWWVEEMTDYQVIARHERLTGLSTSNAAAIDACRQAIKVAVTRARAVDRYEI